MQKRILFILLTLFVNKLNAQKDSTFQIGIFSEYRITPIYTQGLQGYLTGTLQDVYYSEHKQLTGGRIGVQFRLAFTKKKKLSLGFSHIIGYDHLLYESLDGNRYSQNSGEMISKKAFLSDFLFDLKYKFRLRNSGKLSVALGWGLFNNGSEYGVHYEQLGPNGQSTGIFYNTERTFGYNPTFMQLEYEKNTWSFGLNGYFTAHHPFRQPSDILLLAFRIGHTFQIKKK